MHSKKIQNIPNASTLINSMRSIGYDFESAVSDIIDNSLTAKAKKIDIFYPIGDKFDLFLEICDDGIGMNRDELIEAMRFGTNKLVERTRDDLGRFGLGLKTASISQARKFSVISKKEGVVNAFSWDLDEVEKSSLWEMIELDETSIKDIPNIFNYMNLDSFTIVHWTKLDKIETDVSLINNIQDVFLRKVTSTENHVSLVFHRFIEEGIVIRFNNKAIEPIDPFLSRHVKTITKAEQVINTKTSNNLNEKVTMQVFVLPYHKDLDSNDYKKLGGVENADNQGFYIYRNKRLMIYGTWFRIKQKGDLSKNARIKVDIPNTLDDLWSIDIKKQHAKIPAALLEQLRGEVSDAVERSRRMHEYKGTIQTKNDSVWSKTTNKRDNSVIYEINKESSIIKNLFNGLEDKQINQVNRIIEMIQLSLPYKDIYNSVADKKEINTLDENKKNNLINQAISLYKDFKETRNMSKEKIIEHICSYEPFRSANIIEELKVKI